MAMIKKLHSEKGIWGRAVRGSMLGILITFAGAMLLGVLISKDILNEDRMTIYSAVILLLASFAGSGTAARESQSGKIVSSLLTGVIIIGVLFMGTILFFDCQYGVIVVPLGTIAAGLFASCMMTCRNGGSQHPKKRARRKLYKMHNR